MRTTHVSPHRPFPGIGRPLSLAGLGLFVLCLRVWGADPFAENVRPTAPLSPEQEQKAFHLPPGFEIQPVASEPDINTPMNIACDGAAPLSATTSPACPL